MTLASPSRPEPAPGTGKKILIIAGEASGDLQGASLAQALLDVAPGLEIVGVGGARLAAAGARLVEDSTCWGFIGIWDAVLRCPMALGIYQKVWSAVTRERPDLLVLIDSPGFNLRIARYARLLGIPTVYYFPPSAWSPNPARARFIARRVDHVIAAFSFTAEVYRKAGQPVAYFGHPFLDTVKPSGAAAEIRRGLGVPAGKRLVGLMPGSRRQEIGRLAPILLGAARLLDQRIPDLHFVMPVAAPALAKLAQGRAARFGGGLPLSVVEGQSIDVMAASDLALMSSGSASLEAAVLGTPMLLVYRLATPDFWVAPLVIQNFTFMGLPNLILQRAVVPELLQHDATPERVADEAFSLLEDAGRRQEMKDNLSEVKKQLGLPGVVSRVAQYIWETAIHGPGRGHDHQ